MGATALSHQRFGDAAQGDVPADEKAALDEARALLTCVLETGQALLNEPLQFECQKMALQVCIQAEDVTEGRSVLEKLMAMRPGDEELKDDSARLNRMNN